MPVRIRTIMPLIAVGALLAGCGAGPATSGPTATPTGSPETAAPPSSLPMTTLDCPELRSQYLQGDLPQEFYNGVDQGVRVVETSSGTILQNYSLASEAAYDPDASPPAPRLPDRVEPDPDWPKDSVVFIDPASGDVVKAIDVPDELKCAP